jgi:maltooligosyltrehalose synthase
VAFAREHRGQRVLCAVPRLVYTLLRASNGHAAGRPLWQGRLALPTPIRGRYRDIMTGLVTAPAGALDLATLFSHFPVAILRSE